MSAPLPDTASKLPARLPPLREDLQLHPAAANADGSPAWVIQDPLTNGFFRIGWLEFELLSRWHLQEAQQVLADTAAQTLLSPSLDELEGLYLFLLEHQLLQIRDSRYLYARIERQRQGQLGHLRWLLHHYLFFRIPLLHPAQTLRALLPWLAWIFTRTTAGAIAAMGLLALILTARQWDVFVASFLDTLSPGGLIGYLLALAVAKSVHELGHALTATRYGLRVSHMGVAFLVMWPMLYTDTGESWRLAERKERLAIASAGIISELALAILATLAWNLTDDGDMRQALFFLATTAWLVSLALNASPFMRFDGYFILSDALDMPNLHERSFALARCALRNRLLGWHEPDPEPFTPARRRALIAFAYGVWIYRLIAFTGIALAVYFMFFKLLGIILFVVEIVVFVLRPIWNELKLWHAHRSEIAAYRRHTAALVLLALLLVALLPWSYQLSAPGWAHPSAQHVFYSPLPARLLATPQTGHAIQSGEVAFHLDQPELAYRARQAQASSNALDQQVRGLAGLNDGEEKRASLMSQQAMHEAELYAQTDEAARLELKAPFAGEIVDIDPELAKGVWVSPRQPLAVLVAPGQWQAELLVNQKDLPRIRKQAKVRFYPEDNRLSALNGRISDIDSIRSVQLPHPMLSSQHGGPVAVLPDQAGMSVRDTLYRVRVRLEGGPPRLAALRGRAVIEGQAQSWLLEALKPVAIVLIREAGF